MFVIQVGVEGNSQMCLGIWNGRYGKLPLSILRALPLSEVSVLVYNSVHNVILIVDYIIVTEGPRIRVIQTREA